ncbi:MAG: DMT family transporter [Anaerovoracaceae bacterium]
MNKQLKADLMLVLVTVAWGLSYYMMDICLEELEPFTLNAYRFLGAFVIAGILAFPKLKSVNALTLRHSAYIGVALYFTYIGATFGVRYTSLSNAGFLCALAVVITPLLEFVFRKKRLGKKIVAVVILSVVGIGLLTLNEEFKLAMGDLLCLLCAVAYAIDMVLTDIAVNKPRVNAFQVGVFQLFFCGTLCLITAVLTETPKLPESKGVIFSVIFLSVFCTGIAFIVQAVAQQYTTATHVGVIFTLEPVFAGMVAFFLAGEVLLPRAYAGAVLLLVGLFVMEIDLEKFWKKNRGALK